MNEVLARDFFEFGRSGRVHRREDTLDVPARLINPEGSIGGSLSVVGDPPQRCRRIANFNRRFLPCKHFSAIVFLIDEMDRNDG
jgi:hypothetical protein